MEKIIKCCDNFNFGFIKFCKKEIKKNIVTQSVIDLRQSTFLEGRGLMDSVLVANENLEELKRKI